MTGVNPLAFRARMGIWLLGLGASGCQVAGRWEVERIDPPGAPFPLQKLLLDADRNYSALWTEDGKQKGSYGQYQWNGYQLRVAQAGREPRSYGARLGLDGRLRMTYRENGQVVTATLTRPSQTEPRGADAGPPGPARTRTGATEESAPRDAGAARWHDHSRASSPADPGRASQPR